MPEHDSAQQVEQRYVAAMGEALGRTYAMLYNECAWLHLTWKQFVQLFGDNPDRIAILNKTAPGFFRLVRDKLFDALLLHLARLTDPERVGSSGSRETLTLQRLPRLVEEEIRPKINTQLASVLQATKFARDWRNRHVAHRDLRLALREGATPLPEVSRRDIRLGIEAITDLMNTLEDHYMNGAVAYTLVDVMGDADTLLYFVQKGFRSAE